MFDAAHDAGPIVMAVGGRHVVAVVCTHGHNDHVTVAPQLGEALDAPVLLHPADDVLWRMTHPDKDFRTVNDGDTLRVAGHELRAIHTPGHSPGSVCWHAPELGAVFSGDTLFYGGPGATGRSYSDFPTILESISGRSGSCPATPSSTPATATPPPSATRSCTTTNGSPAATSSREWATTSCRGFGASPPRIPLPSTRPNPEARRADLSCSSRTTPGRWADSWERWARGRHSMSADQARAAPPARTAAPFARTGRPEQRGHQPARRRGQQPTEHLYSQPYVLPWPNASLGLM